MCQGWTLVQCEGPNCDSFAEELHKLATWGYQAFPILATRVHCSWAIPTPIKLA